MHTALTFLDSNVIVAVCDAPLSSTLVGRIFCSCVSFPQLGCGHRCVYESRRWISTSDRRCCGKDNLWTVIKAKNEILCRRINLLYVWKIPPSLLNIEIVYSSAMTQRFTHRRFKKTTLLTTSFHVDDCAKQPISHRVNLEMYFKPVLFLLHTYIYLHPRQKNIHIGCPKKTVQWKRKKMHKK